MFRKIPQKLALMNSFKRSGVLASSINSGFSSTISTRPMMTRIWEVQTLSNTSCRNFSSGVKEEDIEFVESKIFEVLKSAAKCDHSKLTRTATFEEMGFDSLDEVELVVAMEEHIGLDISNSDAEKVRSVMDAIQIFYDYYVRSKQPVEEE
ncbi:unnamed protein product [Moneuplotes crassus]|uniref:Acyl carrier protein n=1 Tax=Euplotes crassus TaxID=5936 RepID=A0AAD2D934_EUPCR|nr:unnamed protein product [Moneuplotes crassus]